MIIVASVSCIYGLGSPEAYHGMLLPLEVGQRIDRDQILRKLVEISTSGTIPSSAAARFACAATICRGGPVIRGTRAQDRAVRRRVDELAWFDALTGKVIRRLDKIAVYRNRTS